MGFLSDAWDWTKEAVSDAGDWAKNTAGDVGEWLGGGPDPKLQKPGGMAPPPGYASPQGDSVATQGYYQGNANAAAGRAGPVVDRTQTDRDIAMALGARATQDANIARLQNAADGGDSAAQAQMRQGTADAISAANSMAASGRGAAGAALAGRAGGMAATDAAVRGAGQASALRAQEMASARGLLSQAVDTRRAQDLATRGMSGQESQYQAGLEGQQRGRNDQMQLGYDSLANDVAKSELGVQQSERQSQRDQDTAVYGADVNRQTQRSNSNKALFGEALKGIGAAAAMSDKNAKTDIKKVSSEDVARELGGVDSREFAGPLNAYEYSYKDSANGAGPRIGVMAQDMERSKVGRDAVMNTPNGKMLDVNKALSLALASQADMDKRLRRVEGGK